MARKRNAATRKVREAIPSDLSAAKFFDVIEASRRYGFKPTWFYNQVAREAIPFVKVGKYVKFCEPELDAHFARLRRGGKVTGPTTNGHVPPIEAKKGGESVSGAVMKSSVINHKSDDERLAREMSRQREPLLRGARGAAEFLGVSRAFVYKAVRRRTIPYTRLGGSLRFDPVLLERYLRRNTFEEI
jgi:excisionase family DNA binding protein